MITNDTNQEFTQELSILKKLLADTFAVYIKTLNYHWNIRNTKEFYPLHILLEKHYEELAEAADEIAEVIVSQGSSYAPGTLKELAELTEIKDGTSQSTAYDMLQELARDHRTIVDYARQHQLNSDFLISDLLTTRGRAHNKMAWMLEASIKHTS